jgi:predicted site-specific integrase-resolvase
MALKTSSEAAEELRIAKGTLENWRSSGNGPVFLRIGGKVFYRTEDLETFIKRGLRTSTSQEVA